MTFSEYLWQMDKLSRDKSLSQESRLAGLLQIIFELRAPYRMAGNAASTLNDKERGPAIAGRSVPSQGECQF